MILKRWRENKGLLSIPEGTKKKLPGIIVVHENRGLNPATLKMLVVVAVDGFMLST
jgi:carboxymethylenebutenolidase